MPNASTAASKAPLRRALIGELDSVEQSHAYAGVGVAAQTIAEARILGMIRTGVLLSENVLITDSMLLDGVFFLSVGPTELAARLGRTGLPLPLILSTLSGSLRAALEAKEADPTFTWQLRKHGFLGGGDGAWPPPRVRAAWDAWIDASERGLLPLDTDHVQGPFDPAIRRALLTGVDRPANLSEPAAGLLAVGTTLTRRSTFTTTHDAAVQLSPQVTDFDAVHTWWNDAYLDALAQVTNADWIRFKPRATADPLDKGRGDASRRRFHFSGSVIDTMTAAPPTVFASLHYAVSPQRARLAKSPSQSAVNGIGYAVRQHLAIPSRREVVTSSAIRFLLAAIALTVGLPFVPERWDWIETAWILALVALASMPWGTLLTIWQTSRLSLRGVISVSAGRR
ncbi:hypothetical protein SAMN05216282_10657 [Cryobacterium psychrotolerans]|uniref:Uncharacterized protein n=1 Tax=Cryobacterium psychrotolerans TaxID=386301 RepID=A0A1G9BWP7_9MICO|nr:MULTISPECIES: hypothetical protein [Cryobacterium]TFD42926.1 hypothetical protein E3T33_11315 [Cryobacterium sp. TMT1-2-1]TFD84115.1 hypothetical protein E3T56_10400 [Cryobacterium psychrotolerans]SDK43879.1 hypothetical protein SAMN05216282_10657 [Cryobacterium psychrotolerans]